jgi:hypothetical protein
MIVPPQGFICEKDNKHSNANKLARKKQGSHPCGLFRGICCVKDCRFPDSPFFCRSGE